MFIKTLRRLIIAALAFVTTAVVGQGASGGAAYLRVLQLANDGIAVSFTLEDGRTIATNLGSGSASDYVQMDASRSTFLSLTITPRQSPSFFREWSVPALTAGHYTAALVGSITDNSLQLTFIDEDTLCAGKFVSGSCVILVDNIRGAPALTLLANSTPMISNARYRHVVVNGVIAGTYLTFRGVDPNNIQTVLFQLQRRFFEPNTIYVYSLTGSYAAGSFTSFNVGAIRRVPVDSMTFLRGLKANLQLSDGTTLFATENIVSILETTGLDRLVANLQLPLTVFAPTDGAVLDAAADLYQCAIGDPAAMRALILNHILIGSYTPAQLINATRVPAISGISHTFTATSGGFLVDNTVRVPDTVRYPTANGTVYVIDTVLVPPGFTDQYCTSG